MTYIEVPLWLVIIILICSFLLLAYFMVGDLLARLIHKYYKLTSRETDDHEEEENDFI